MTGPKAIGSIAFTCCGFDQQSAGEHPTCRLCGTVYRLVLEPLPFGPLRFAPGTVVRLIQPVTVTYPVFPHGPREHIWPEGTTRTVGADPYQVLSRGGDPVLVEVDVRADRAGTLRILVPVPADVLEIVRPATPGDGESTGEETIHDAPARDRTAPGIPDGDPGR